MQNPLSAGLRSLAVVMVRVHQILVISSNLYGSDLKVVCGGK